MWRLVPEIRRANRAKSIALAVSMAVAQSCLVGSKRAAGSLAASRAVVGEWSE